MPSLFASYLRVYEPLTAFDRDRQVFWRRYVREGRAVAPARGAGPAAYGGASRRSAPAGPGCPTCPTRRTSWRPTTPCWSARGTCGCGSPRRRSTPATACRRCSPTPSCRRCWPARRRAVVDDWRSGARVLEHGVPRVHEQIATWGVPLRWFVFVDLGERDLVIKAGPAVAALPHGDLQGPAARVAGRCRCCASRSATRRSPRRSRRRRGGWRSSIPRSVVELDYGGLVDLLPDDDLDGGRLARAGGGGPGRAVAGRRRRGDRGVREAGGPVARGPAAGTVQLSGIIDAEERSQGSDEQCS